MQEATAMEHTNTVTVLRCALCRKPFSYLPLPTDCCRPDHPKIICDQCYKANQEAS
jgi:hypothetical protein